MLRSGPRYRTKPLTDAELEEIERLARTDAAEAYRGPLLALVDEVRRLRALLDQQLGSGSDPESH